MKKKFLPFINRRYAHVVGSPTCGAETLPETDFDFCDPQVALSEIGRVFIAKIGAVSFTDWTQPDEWALRVSETEMDMDTIRPLTVIADKPAPAKTVKEISGGRKFTTRKDHTINFTIDEVTDTNHAFIQYIENTKRFKMWYETQGGFMFGGNNGITVEMSGDMELQRGAGNIQVYNGILTWISQLTESRCISPIFSETLLGSIQLDTTISFATDATPAHGSSDWILVGGTSAVANFQYNDINPTIGAALVMTVKVGGVLKLTANMKADYDGQQFKFKDIGGVTHSGIIHAGDVLF